jgi:hypothetical protein
MLSGNFEEDEMAVLAIFSGKGITRDSYDQLRKEIDWEHQHPAGGIFHAASFDDNGDAHVADVWASPDALNDFVASRLMPTMQKLQIPAPEVAVYPIHNMNAYPAIDQYKV